MEIVTHGKKISAAFYAFLHNWMFIALAL